MIQYGKTSLATIGLVAILGCGAPSADRTTPPQDEAKSRTYSFDREAEVPVGGNRLGVVAGAVWLVRSDGSLLQVKQVGEQWHLQQGGIRGCSRVVSASGSGMVCRDGEARFAFFGEGGERLPLPRNLALGSSVLTATTPSGTVAILSGRTLAIWDDGHWKLESSVLANPSKRLRSDSSPTSMVVVGDTVFLGYSRGEWGGLVISFRHGQRSSLPQEAATKCPVIAFHRGPGDQLWVLTSMAHLQFVWSQLLLKSGAGFKTTLDTEQWTLGDSYLRAVGVPGRNRRYVVSNSLGLVQRKPGGAWTQVDESWRPAVIVDVIFRNGSVFLLLESELRIIDLATHSTTRLPDLSARTR